MSVCLSVCVCVSVLMLYEVVRFLIHSYFRPHSPFAINTDDQINIYFSLSTRLSHVHTGLQTEIRLRPEQGNWKEMMYVRSDIMGKLTTRPTQNS